MEAIFDNQFLLDDRIQKIRSINEMYDLKQNGFISFSGGKDSTVLHYLIDEALPGNTMPRVFFNTGIEYKLITEYVKNMAAQDSRFILVPSGVNIKKMLEDKGYPFKSKEHSLKLSVYQNSGETKTVSDYLGKGNKKSFLCPGILKYQFSPSFQIKISKKCCDELKKKTSKKWAIDNNRTITLTGMRQGEGGLRNRITCTVFDESGLGKFHPLAPLTSDWVDWYIEQKNIKLCDLYYPPYNFKRTGCKGCPYAINLAEELEVMKQLLPNEYKNCEHLWGPVYNEYRRIGYRLPPIIKEL